MRQRLGLLITHDRGFAADMADRRPGAAELAPGEQSDVFSVFADPDADGRTGTGGREPASADGPTCGRR